MGQDFSDRHYPNLYKLVGSGTKRTFPSQGRIFLVIFTCLSTSHADPYIFSQVTRTGVHEYGSCREETLHPLQTK